MIVEDRNRKTKARPDFTVGKKKYQAELIPPALIIRRWFAAEQSAIEKLEADLMAFSLTVRTYESALRKAAAANKQKESA